MTGEEGKWEGHSIEKSSLSRRLGLEVDGSNFLKLGLGLGIDRGSTRTRQWLGNDSGGLILMTRFIKKHIKYLNFKEKIYFKGEIHL